MERSIAMKETHVKILEKRVDSLNLYIQNQQLYNPILAQIQLVPIREIEEQARIHQMNTKHELYETVVKMQRGLRLDQGTMTLLKNTREEISYDVKHKLENY